MKISDKSSNKQDVLHVIASFQYHISVLLNMASAAGAPGG